MGSNPFFNNFNDFGEQSLLEDLIIESISIYGHTVLYLPRTLVNKDDLYGEDSVSLYNQVFTLDMYIKNVDSFEGDGQFLSKFNLEIRDQTTFTLARTTFRNHLSGVRNDRPLEGDLIYSPMMRRLFVIKYVNNTNVFYQLGNLTTWDVICEVFEYSNERFNTGHPTIDAFEETFSVDEFNFGILTNDGYTLTNHEGYPILQTQYDYDDQMGDVFADNDEIQEEGDDLFDWTEADPFSEGLV